MGEVKKNSGYIMLSPDDVPSISQIEDAISRLNKDSAILSRGRGNNDENPESLEFIASFLQSFINTYKKQLKK